MRIEKNAINRYSQQADLSQQSLNSKHFPQSKAASRSKAKDAAAFAEVLKRAMQK